MRADLKDVIQSGGMDGLFSRAALRLGVQLVVVLLAYGLFGNIGLHAPGSSL